MISFKSIFARIIFLHVIAMVITAMFMPLVLYWFLKSAANDLHRQAMRDQGELLAVHLAAGENGQLTDNAAIFPHDLRSSEDAFLETCPGKAAISGVSIPKQVGDHRVWIEVGENLAHRDVIIDDIVAEFFKRVGWITLPILLLLLAIDIAIFQRALRPLRKASIAELRS